jgi:hypothetical protein
LEQLLDVRLRNPAKLELRWLHIAIKEPDRYEVREAVVGSLLGVDIFLWTEAPTPGEIVSDLKDLSIDTRDVGRIKWVSLV